MSEPAFREIQLTKKQLVFLFMASVVLAAVVFLLGVSLGRKLPTGTQAAASMTPAAEPPAEMPLPTGLTKADQQFSRELGSGGPVPPETPVPPPSATPASTPQGTTPAATPAADDKAPTPPATTSTPAAAPKPADTPAARPAAQAAPAASAKPAPAAAPAAPAGSWFVQVNAFKSRENADAEVRKLKGQGHAAFVQPGGSLFRVRVGPFGARAEADATQSKLRQAGYKPSITR